MFAGILAAMQRTPSKRWSLVLLMTVLIELPTNGEPRGVRLREELAEAQTIVRVRITGYRQGTVKWEPFEPKDAPKSARCSTDAQWTPQPSPPAADGVYTAHWPQIGDDVLVVVDKDGAISLFAQLMGDKWRFWSPIMTGSVASFDCVAPATPLKGQERGSTGSWDGCYLPRNAVSPRGTRLDDKNDKSTAACLKDVLLNTSSGVLTLKATYIGVQTKPVQGLLLASQRQVPRLKDFQAWRTTGVSYANDDTGALSTITASDAALAEVAQALRHWKLPTAACTRKPDANGTAYSLTVAVANGQQVVANPRELFLTLPEMQELLSRIAAGLEKENPGAAQRIRLLR